jgi:hypothetical protein
MKTRFILFRRAGVFYSEDTVTRKPHSLRTKDEAEALTILHSKNEAHQQPVLNLQIARAYLTAIAPRAREQTTDGVLFVRTFTLMVIDGQAFYRRLFRPGSINKFRPRVLSGLTGKGLDV